MAANIFDSPKLTTRLGNILKQADAVGVQVPNVQALYDSLLELDKRRLSCARAGSQLSPL